MQPSILNVLHIPKTGGSSIWHSMVALTVATGIVKENTPLAYDYYHETIKDRIPFDPATATIHFLCESGILPYYDQEMYDRHSATIALFTDTLRPTIACHRVLTHAHFPAPIPVSEEIITVASTRESTSRFLSHASHLLRSLTAYRDGLTNGECGSNRILESFEFSRNVSVLEFCAKLFKLRPRMATHQLRYLLATLCSRSCAESFKIMVHWSNRDVIEAFQRSFEVIRRRTRSIRLENGRFTLSQGAAKALSEFGFDNFNVDRCVLETVATPRELKDNSANDHLRELFPADQMFFKSLMVENELLRQLHGY